MKLLPSLFLAFKLSGPCQHCNSYLVLSYLDSLRGKLHPNGWLGLQTELVPGKPGEQTGLSYSRISHQNNFEQVVVVILARAPTPWIVHLINIPNSEVCVPSPCISRFVLQCWVRELSTEREAITSLLIISRGRFSSDNCLHPNIFSLTLFSTPSQICQLVTCKIFRINIINSNSSRILCSMY